MSQLVLRHRSPCNECPFRKDSKKGYFGPFQPAFYLEMAHGEKGIACHKYKHEERYRAACVGALQHANASCKIYANPALNQLQREVGKSSKILDYMEFKVHHMGYKFKPLGLPDED